MTEKEQDLENDLKDQQELNQKFLSLLNQKLEFPLLTENEIDVRIGTVSREDKKDKSSAIKGISLLLYKDARVDMSLLDQIVGASRWQRLHKEIKGVVYCGVSIYFNEIGWVTKWDAGVESNTEKEKGEASDSFKRACFNWGLGRELYTAPFIWVKAENIKNEFDKFSVKSIGYNDKREINSLVIMNDTLHKVAYTFGSQEEKPEETEEISPVNDFSNKSDNLPAKEEKTFESPFYKYDEGKEAYAETVEHFDSQTNKGFTKEMWQRAELPNNFSKETIQKIRQVCSFEILKRKERTTADEKLEEKGIL